MHELVPFYHGCRRRHSQDFGAGHTAPARGGSLPIIIDGWLTMFDSVRTNADNHSLWLDKSPGHEPCPAVLGQVDTDVAVIGGGLTGASVALHLARMGVAVALVDGPAEYAPATAASGGIVAPQLVRALPSDVKRRLGEEGADALLSLYAEAGAYTFALIAQEGIDCAASSAGFLAPFITNQQGASARRSVEEWRHYRENMRLLDAEETASISGCRGYAGAVLDESGGSLDPERYRLGLLASAHRHGAAIFSDRVLQPVQGGNGGYHIICAAGEIRARRVILAANGGNTTLWPTLANSVLPLPVCEVATVPLPDDMRAVILPQGHAMTDLQTDIFTLRYDVDGRLITACPKPQVIDRQAIEREINQRLSTMIPGWRPMEMEHVWTGTAWLNTNLLPRLVRCDEGVVAVQACNGRGIAMSALTGRDVAQWIVDPTRPTQLPMVRPKRVVGYFIARHIPRLMMIAAKLKRPFA